MSIRMRLIVSYIAMVMVPLVLLLIIGIVTFNLFFGGTEADGHEVRRIHGIEISSFWESIDKRQHIINGVEFMAERNSKLLTENDFLAQTDQELRELQAGLMIVKDERVIYASPLVNHEGLEEQLKRMEENAGKHGMVFRGQASEMDYRYNVERFDFTFDDQSAGSLYFLSDINPLFHKMLQFAPILFLSVLLTVGLTNGLLTFFVSRSIIRPLDTLKLAAERIKEGDLDHPLNIHRKDEFGKVGEAFEEMRERLKRSIRMQLQYEENRKELISNISHDLKTPITGIRACVEGLRDGIADTEEKRNKYVRMIDQKTADMDRMIEELFLFSKLDLKRQPFHFEKVDIYGFLSDCAAELQADPRFRGVEVMLRTETTGPLYVTADREKMKRVMMNIAENSLKYMNKPEKILQIDLLRGAKEVTVRIMDNGSGIGSEALPYVFERFYRAEPSRNALTGGSGLGLSIVKHIVEEHGGTVRADSTVGQGTAISLTLPREEQKYTGGEQA